MKLVKLSYNFPHKSIVARYGGCSAEAVLVPKGLWMAGRLQLGVAGCSWWWEAQGGQKPAHTTHLQENI